MSNFDRFPVKGPGVIPRVSIRAVAAPDSLDWPREPLDGPDLRAWLAAIIDGSDDAILSKDLNGVIRTWNGGAERLFGYSAQEAIGQPVTMLIPDDRLDEEPEIIEAIRRGDRVDHFETRRRRKDGSLIDISLTISPIYNRQGTVVGASKIARDITERHRHEEQQNLLLGEMNHRVKNLFSLALAVVSLSIRTAPSPAEAPELIRERIELLARAHEATLASWRPDVAAPPAAGLHELLATILAPYDAEGRISITGADPEVGGASVANLALIMHELATNSAKYGSLSVFEGGLNIEISEDADSFTLVWRERGGPAVAEERTPGFGGKLERGLAMALGAEIAREWRPDGLVVRLRAPRSAAPSAPMSSPRSAPKSAPKSAPGE